MSPDLSKSIHALQTHLLDLPRCTPSQLHSAAALLSRPDYADVVTERAIAGVCGFPLCSNPLPPLPSRKGRYRISLKEHRVYDLRESHDFCSERCAVESKAFKGALEEERGFGVGVGRVQEVLGLFEVKREEKEEEVRLGVSKLTIKERDDVEGQGLPMEEWVGPTNAIEGYVPQRDRNQEFKRRPKSKPKTEVQTETRSEEVDFVSEVFVGDPSFGVSRSGIGAPSTVPLCYGENSKQTAGGIAAKDEVGIMTSSVIENPPVSASSHSATFPSRKSELQDIASSDATSHKYKNNADSEAISREYKNDADSQGKSCEFESGTSSQPNGLEDADGSKDKVKPQEKALKSILKRRDSKGRNCSVRWADKEQTKASVDKESQPIDTSSTQVSNNLDDERFARLAAAEACAAALLQASEAVNSGEYETEDAVSEVGIIINPAAPSHDNEEDNSEVDEDDLYSERAVQKWPKKPVLLDTDMFEVEDSLHDTPPGGFSLTLSTFASMWMALFGWITCSSLAYIYGRDENMEDEFLYVNGREYPRKIVLSDGRSFEIKQTLAACIARALPQTVSSLRLPTSMSHIEKSMGKLLGTMSFVDALPPLKTKEWHVIILLFIDALSVSRIPSLSGPMLDKRVLLHKVLDAACVGWEEYEIMKDHIIPLGRLPQFSLHSGA